MLDEMRTFVLFAEEGSIQKVARRLPLTQPAVTRQIQRLEDVLGLELLDRRQKPPGLTPAGVEVLSRSRRILAEYAEMKQLAKRAEPEGVLRLGLTHGLADDSVANAVSAALKPFPRVSLRLRTAWSDELADQHRRGLLDAAIILSSDAANAEIIGRESLAVIASPAALKEKRHGAGRLPELSWILSPEPCDARRLLTAVMSRRGRQLAIGAEVQDAGLQIALVRQGFGLGLMPERLLSHLRPAGVTIVRTDPLTLNVVLLRSPHLWALADVVDALAKAVGALMQSDRA
jgi:DNA-binding transcriptional LysR family regulator